MVLEDFVMISTDRFHGSENRRISYCTSSRTSLATVAALSLYCLEMDTEQLEREMVAIIVSEYHDKRGWSHSDFVRQVWGGSKADHARWKRIRNQSKGGKPQPLSIGDLYAIANTLGWKPQHIQWEAEHRMTEEQRQAEST